LWATGNKAPAVDSVNAYSTTFTVNPDNSVSFRSVRPLAPDESTETFVIQLNTPINMIVAYKTTGYTLSYHGANKFSWTMQLNSDGTSGGTSTGS